MFYKKDVLRNFAKFTGKHLCQSLFFNKVASLRLFIEHPWWLLLKVRLSWCYCKTCSPNQRTTENVCLENSPKKTSRIITNLLLSFSIYLVSLSLYTKLVYKVLLKKHLTFVANINPMFFHHYTALKLLYTLLCNSSQS